MKTCASCKEQKPAESFSRQTKSKDGRYPYCKECAAKRLRVAYRARGKQSWVNDKTCAWCRELKPKTAYRSTGPGKVTHRCLACEADIAAKASQGLKRCNVCREWLLLGAFQPSQLRKENTPCRECTRTWHREHTDDRRAYMLKKEYGITAEQYDELVAKQGGKCPICDVPFEPGDRSNPVDHSHGGKDVGRIRAILHNDCNRFVMWMHEDSRQLRAAADLIDNPLTDWYVPGVPNNQRRKDRQK